MSLFHLFILNSASQSQHRPALTLGAVARSHPTMSVHTHPRLPFSWGPSPVAPCPAWPQQMPPRNICVNLLMRFPMMCPCPLGGRWPKPPLVRDTSSSKYTNDKCQCLHHRVLGVRKPKELEKEWFAWEGLSQCLWAYSNGLLKTTKESGHYHPVFTPRTYLSFS